MTKGPTPTPQPRNEGEYARKLALAILSTLEQKGLLTRLEVDTILQAAHRASQPAPAVPVPALQIAVTPQPASAPAPLGTRWVKPGTSAAPESAPVPTGRPNEPQQTPAEAPKPGPGAIIIPSPEETEAVAVAPVARQPEDGGASQQKQPPVIDFTLD